MKWILWDVEELEMKVRLKEGLKQNSYGKWIKSKE